MARASARMREMAIRAALGGSRARLIRQMLAETMLLAALGGSMGVSLGWWISGMISWIHFQNVPVHLDTRLDWAVFAYAFAVVAFTGMFVGLSSALKATASDANAVLQQRNGKDAGRHKVRRDLMVLQVAWSLMLLIIAGLITRSLLNAERINLGFDPNLVLNVALDPQINSYNEAQTRLFYEQLKSKIKVMPGVQSVSSASSMPITSFPSRQKIYVEGQVASADHQLPSILFNRVDPDYFKTMRIPILLGREFSDSDSQTAPLWQSSITLWPADSGPGKNRLANASALETRRARSYRSSGLRVTISTRPLPRIRLQHDFS